MFYHSELKMINREHSVVAPMQFTSRFLDLTLEFCRSHSAHLSLVE